MLLSCVIWEIVLFLKWKSKLKLISTDKQYSSEAVVVKLLNKFNWLEAPKLNFH